jgi:hypothetical protein
MRSAYKILTGKPEGKRPLRSHSHRWEDNMEKPIKETVGGWGLDSSGSV